jgi:hypothetical protein
MRDSMEIHDPKPNLLAMTGQKVLKGFLTRVRAHLRQGSKGETVTMSNDWRLFGRSGFLGIEDVSLFDLAADPRARETLEDFKQFMHASPGRDGKSKDVVVTVTRKKKSPSPA